MGPPILPLLLFRLRRRALPRDRLPALLFLTSNTAASIVQDDPDLEPGANDADACRLAAHRLPYGYATLTHATLPIAPVVFHPHVDLLWLRSRVGANELAELAPYYHDATAAPQKQQQLAQIRNVLIEEGQWAAQGTQECLAWLLTHLPGVRCIVVLLASHRFLEGATLTTVEEYQETVLALAERDAPVVGALRRELVVEYMDDRKVVYRRLASSSHGAWMGKEEFAVADS